VLDRLMKRWDGYDGVLIPDNLVEEGDD
jgi:hypothetical protein